MGPRRESAERFFSRHAEGYAKSTSHAQGHDLTALLEALRPVSTDVALDVATGTGFTAISLAKLVEHVTGIDVTDEMLTQARLLAKNRRVGNIRFERGDAHQLKYADSSFDIVTTRRATHHFADVPRFLLEAKRVLRPTGRLGIVDMSPPEGAESFSNRIERLRDSSHIEAFPPSDWRSMLGRAGLQIVSERVLEEPTSFNRWLYPVELGGREEKMVRLAWRSASTEVRSLLKAKTRKNIVQGWTKSRIVLVATVGR